MESISHVMKSQCSKMKCEDYAKKPSMIQVDYDEMNSKKRKFHHTQRPTCSKQSEEEEKGDNCEVEDMIFEQ